MRNNIRYCSFVTSNAISDFLTNIYEFGLYIENRNNLNDYKLICIPSKYGNNTYKFDLSNLTEEEYEKYEKYFSTVIDNYVITYSEYKCLLYMDDDNCIFLGSIEGGN